MDVNNQYGALEIQKKLLVLLKDFHSFCLNNQIKYSLDWGSLLGAVRHQGFIPWDDDLDIMVDRQNYIQLVGCISKSKSLVFDASSPEALWVSRIRMSESKDGHGYPPMIDIFIVDNAPDGTFAKKWRLLCILFLQGMLKEHPVFNKGSYAMRLCTSITFLFGLLFTRKTKLKWYHKLSQCSNNKKTKQVTSYYEEYRCMGKYYSSSLLENVVSVPFEDMEALVTKEWHECLSVQFGDDYITPPNEENRVSRHVNLNIR